MNITIHGNDACDFTGEHYPTAQAIAQDIVDAVTLPPVLGGVKLNQARIANYVFGHYIMTGEWCDAELEAEKMPLYLYVDYGGAGGQ